MVMVRLVSIVFLTFAAIAVGAELVDFIRNSYWTPISARQLWLNLDAASLAAVQSLIERQILPDLWDPVMVWILRQPAWAVTAVPGLSLLLLSVDWSKEMPRGWDQAGKQERLRLQRTH